MNKELAKASGLSEAVLSRYRTGSRIPGADSPQLYALADGLCAIGEKNGVDLNRDNIINQFRQGLADESAVDSDKFVMRLRTVLEELNCTNKEIAYGTSYDSSYISRILRGTRKPEKPWRLINLISTYFSSPAISTDKKIKLCRLMNEKEALIDDTENFRKAVFRYLSASDVEDIPQPAIISVPVGSFLNKIDKFDLEDYVKRIPHDQMEIPFLELANIPHSKYYSGIEQMKQSEIDFINATLKSDSKESIISYSDMPLGEMAKDIDFYNIYMTGLAMIIKKGLHINFVHDVNRPFAEMMLGLEAYIPLYMTGQISPYYLKNPSSKDFHHLLKVSGAAALTGSAIVNHHASGVYHITTESECLPMYRKLAEDMINHSYPLMKIYTADRREDFYRQLEYSHSLSGVRKIVYSSLPLFTINPELLNSILHSNSVSAENAEKIKHFAEMSRKKADDLLRRNEMTIMVPKITKASFAQRRPVLYIPELFLHFGLRYSSDEYFEHLIRTKDFAMTHPSCTLQINEFPSFNNIDFTIISGKQVIVSKAKSPAIHFIIRHPRMVRSFERFSATIRT